MKMIERVKSFACKAHQSSASPGSIRVREANAVSSKASLSDGARNACKIDPRYVGIGTVDAGY